MSTIIETSSGEFMKVWTKDPYSAQKKYIKRRKQDDPDFLRKCNEDVKSYLKQRYAEDEEFRKSRIEAVRRCQEKAKFKKMTERKAALTDPPTVCPDPT